MRTTSTSVAAEFPQIPSSPVSLFQPTDHLSDPVQLLQLQFLGSAIEAARQSRLLTGDVDGWSFGVYGLKMHSRCSCSPLDIRKRSRNTVSCRDDFDGAIVI